MIEDDEEYGEGTGSPCSDKVIAIVIETLVSCVFLALLVYISYLLTHRI